MNDVVIVGGSYAGISAGLQLARARRRVLVVDTGTRRNRFADSSHGFLGQDGRDPAAIAAQGRAELLAYPTVTWVDGAAIEARAAHDGFVVALASGERHDARRLILAAGVVDVLPAIPGVMELWGRSIFHCPYCHGYELDRGRIGVLASSALSLHQALMLPDWGETTYFTRGLFEPNEQERAELARRGVTVERSSVVAVTKAEDGAQVQLDDGRKLSFAGLFVLPKTQVGSPLAAQLGCALDEGPLGPYLRTDPTKETTVPGVFACGDVALPMGSVAIAVADGVWAGTAAHRSLMFR